MPKNDNPFAGMTFGEPEDKSPKDDVPTALPPKVNSKKKTAKKKKETPVSYIIGITVAAAVVCSLLIWGVMQLSGGKAPATKKGTAKTDEVKTETKAEPPKVEAPKVTPPKVTPPKVEAPKAETPKVTPPKVTPPVVTPPKVTPPMIVKVVVPKAEGSAGSSRDDTEPYKAAMIASGGILEFQSGFKLKLGSEVTLKTAKLFLVKDGGQLRWDMSLVFEVSGATTASIEKAPSKTRMMWFPQGAASRESDIEGARDERLESAGQLRFKLTNVK